MQNDKITLKDLSIFSNEGEEDVFGLINYTTTQAGKEFLRKHIHEPPNNFETLQKTQQAVRFWSQQPDLWPSVISNGTLVMLEKFFEAADEVSAPPSGLSLLLGNFFQKLLNRNHYFLTQFSLSHLSDFLKGCLQLTDILMRDDVPVYLQKVLQDIADELKAGRLVNDIVSANKETPFAELQRLCHNARLEMKHMVYRLISYYARLDAWQAMAKATVQLKWVFPEILETKPLYFEATDLYHPLLKYPVPYSISFNDSRNFLFITGANMSGKTTFMRSLGVAALLAHLGMGVPATSLRLSFLHGIITNMQVEDNILLGESYFFAEVQRMKFIAQKLLKSETQLVLMDELFKGTNVHDAYECTKAVVDGLLHRPDHLMLLSTHLYEVAGHFEGRNELQFVYFVTKMIEDGNYQFTYELKEGISDDRIGYRILQKEGVIKLLERRTDN